MARVLQGGRKIQFMRPPPEFWPPAGAGIAPEREQPHFEGEEDCRGPQARAGHRSRGFSPAAISSSPRWTVRAEFAPGWRFSSASGRVSLSRAIHIYGRISNQGFALFHR